MEALRNHVQHYGLPVHWVSTGSRWTSPEADGLMEFSVDLLAVRTRLAEDGTFKKEVLAELSERIDLKAAVRRYLESIGTVHEGTGASSTSGSGMSAAGLAIERYATSTLLPESNSPIALHSITGGFGIESRIWAAFSIGVNSDDSLAAAGSLSAGIPEVCSRLKTHQQRAKTRW